MQMQPRAEEPDQNQVCQQYSAGHPVDAHATLSFTNCAADVERSEAPETSRNLETKKIASANRQMTMQAMPRRRIQGSDCTRRMASAGIPPRGDSAIDGPRTRRIFS